MTDRSAHDAIIAAVLASSVAIAGCQSERVVSVSGGLLGVPGASHNYGQDVPIRGRDRKSLEGALASHAPIDDENLKEIESEPLRFTDEDDDVILVSRSPRHVVFHLTRTLDRDEHDLLYEQVISEATKREYRERARDPRDALRFIIEHKEPIRELLDTMPMGEQTPGLFIESIGENRFRLTAPPAMARQLRFDHADFIIEDGMFRLLVIR